MKTYKSFKMIARLRDAIDCYMTGLWTDSNPKKDNALKIFYLYHKNWAEGLTSDEWKEAKSLKEFWNNETQQYVQ